MMQTISSYSTTHSGKSIPAFTRSTDNSRSGRAKERILIRLAAASLFFLLLFLGLSLLTGHADSEYPAAPTADEQIYVVGSGDTLWEIASDVRKEGEDIRRTVFDLQKRNNLSSSMLKAGQTLIIPAGN